jgi:UDP-N-acetylmuramoyl-tripeptide--D-alanyl-D-alanine ligase
MTAPLWTTADAAAATSGKATAAFAATGISIDSRTAQKGDLFVALKGPNHNGHDHLGAAFAAGAVAAMVERAPANAGGPLLVVPETLRGLEALGRAARARSAAKVAAVTGSVGKTGTKEALRLAHDIGGHPHQPVHASAASLNNHIGVPLTLALLPQDAEYAVIEIGMNHAGEITPLSRLARPHVAIVTTVEAVHTANFADGIDGVAAGKAEIFDGFDGGSGIAVLNRDNRFFGFLAERATARGASMVLGFGAHADADYRLVDFRAETAASVVTASIHGRTITYRIGVPGRHWAMNTLAVLAAAESFGVTAEEAAESFASLQAPKGRGQRHRVALGDGSFELIDDSYNASPASMRAAFEVLRAAQPGQGGRRIAVLGDMLELGADAPEIHAALAGPLQAAEIDLVFTCGPDMARLHEALPSKRRGGHAAASDALLPLARTAMRAGDVVLVKGSRGSRMDRIVNGLLAGAGINGNGNRPHNRAANG